MRPVVAPICAPGSGHREDDGLGDLVEDHPPAPHIAQAAQAERAELRLQEIADLGEPVLSLVDPGPRVGAGIRQEPPEALRRDVRRVELDRQEQPVRIQQTAEQAIAIGRVQLARELCAGCSAA